MFQLGERYFSEERERLGGEGGEYEEVGVGGCEEVVNL